jgi:hypothetical protein
MPRKRDPNFKTGHLCRFCGELVSWGTILCLIRVDADTPPPKLSFLRRSAIRPPPD